MDETCEQDPQKRKWIDVMVERVMVGVLKNNASLTSQVLDRIEGKVPLPITGPDRGPMELDVNMQSMREKIVAQINAMSERKKTKGS